MAAGIDDGIIAVEDAIAELVLAQELPDVLDWIEFGRIRRQFEQAEIFRNFEFPAGLMPPSAVEHDDGVASGCDVTTDLGEVQVHGFAVDVRQNERRSEIAFRTDGTEQIGPGVTLVARCARSGAALGPDAGQRALLPDAGFVLPPDFDRLVARVRRDAGADQIRKVFLCAS